MNKVTQKLFDAIEDDEISEVESAILNKADINAKDDTGDTPLSLASEYGFLDIVQMLVEHGADLNKTNDSGDTPLKVAVQNCYKDVAEYLIGKMDRPLDPTLMHTAATMGYVEIGKMLLENGVPVDGIKDDSGKVPIHWAAQLGELDFCKWLVDNGANPDPEDDDGATPLIQAVGEGVLDIAEYLISKGADVNHISESGTPLTLAFAWNRPDMIDLLDKSGIRYDIMDDDNYAIWYAVDHEYRDIIVKYAHKFNGILSPEELARLRKRAARRGVEDLVNLLPKQTE